MADASHRLDDEELAAYERDGYLVRRAVFGTDEVADMAAHSEADEMERSEIDPSVHPGHDAVAVEVEAGSTVTFGSLLVHQSTPNPSSDGRRALLYSYQPAGRERVIDHFRRMAQNLS